MSTLTLVPPIQEPTGILGRLLADARAVFEAGPVLVLELDTGDAVPLVREVAAHAAEVARHTLLEWHGREGGDIKGLQDELWELNAQLDGATFKAEAVVAFPVITFNVRNQITGLVLAQAMTWLVMQLESDPVTKQESERRYSLRRNPERLIQPQRPARRRIRRTPRTT